MRNTIRSMCIFVLTIFTASMAFAGAQFFNGSTDLGIFNQVACSTGMTCARLGPKVLITSSPTLADTLAISAAEATDATFYMKADESDDNGDDWLFKVAASGNAFSLSNDVSGSQVAKLSVSTAGAVTFTGSIVGYTAPLVAATATTITAAQCGSTFYNSGAVEMELPEASTVLGCTLSFVTLNASNFDIDPDAADQILVLTNAAGDSIRNATLGNTVTIRAVSASQWVVVGVQGTWSDNN